MPDVGCEVWDWEAGVYVDELEVPCYRDAGLGFGYVAADVFAFDVWGVALVVVDEFDGGREM